MRKGKILYLFLLSGTLFLFAFSAWQYGSIELDYIHEKNVYDELRNRYTFQNNAEVLPTSENLSSLSAEEKNESPSEVSISENDPKSEFSDKLTEKDLKSEETESEKGAEKIEETEKSKNFSEKTGKRKKAAGNEKPMETDVSEKKEDIPISPLTVDWEELQKQNPDTVGWIFVSGASEISYPIVQGTDDSFYVDHTFEKETSRSGCIFLSSFCDRNFTSPHSIIYGHNMHDGSETMFTRLSELRNQKILDQNPFFWILTPDGDLCYRIFSVFETERSSDVFQVWSNPCDDFTDWMREMQSRSLFRLPAVRLSGKEHIVTLVTCVPNSYNRTVIMGICLSKVS